MITIFKYPLLITEEQVLELPLFAQILSVKLRETNPKLKKAVLM